MGQQLTKSTMTQASENKVSDLETATMSGMESDTNDVAKNSSIYVHHLFGVDDDTIMKVGLTLLYKLHLLKEFFKAALVGVALILLLVLLGFGCSYLLIRKYFQELDRVRRVALVEVRELLE